MVNELKMSKFFLKMEKTYVNGNELKEKEKKNSSLGEKCGNCQNNIFK